MSPQLDLHGIPHSDVQELVSEWIYCQPLPLKIITGNSDKMKKIVTKTLNSLKYTYIIGDNINQGYIKVTTHESSY